MPYDGAATVRATMARSIRTWNERLNWALRERGVSKSELARACKIERASVTEWTNGKTKDPKLSPFFLACDTLRINPRWLALGEGPIEPPLADTFDGSETIVETIRRLADHLSDAEQRHVLRILQSPLPPV
jgi:transcriptional regulator with XRE-family HTH domain